MSKGVIMSGMRPTGKLHMGHMSVLENWAKLQHEYKCYFVSVDLHALTTSFEEADQIKDNIRANVIDWLAAGIDPEISSIFVQSQVKEHAELHTLLSMITPLSWLERVPTWKDQIAKLGEQGKDINTYGFLGYPLLQAADILIYRANAVPVGEDQIPHIELTREVGRRFNYMYKTDVFPEAQAIVNQDLKLLPGVDGRKMSKSYHNAISIGASSEEIMTRVKQMVTDPQRLRKDDPGRPEVCTVYTYHKVYNPEEVDNVAEMCRKGTIGCVACKKNLAAKLDQFMAPIRDRREYYLGNPQAVEKVLEKGREEAQVAARATMELVKAAIGI